MSNVILSTHAFIPKAELGDMLDPLREQLTVRSRFEPHTTLKLYRETPDCFGMPLYLSDWQADNIIDQRITGFPAPFGMVSGFTPRPRQKPIIGKWLELLKAGSTGFLFSLPTGTRGLHPPSTPRDLSPPNRGVLLLGYRKGLAPSAGDCLCHVDV